MSDESELLFYISVAFFLGTGAGGVVAWVMFMMGVMV